MKQRITCVCLLLCMALYAQDFIPPLPSSFGVTNSFINGECQITNAYNTFFVKISWDEQPNAESYDLFGGYNMDVTNKLARVYGKCNTNAWFQGTNVIYFFKVSANLTN